jgi:small subunit ribosomal protein S14
VAKLSLIQREKKREQLVAKFAKKHAELTAIANDAKKSDEERYARAWSCRSCRATPTRRACATACELTGARAARSAKFGLARNKIRELAFKGDIPGVVKASW